LYPVDPYAQPVTEDVRMSDQYGPLAGAEPYQPPQPPKLPFRKRKPKTFWTLVILAGLFVIGGISNAINPPKDTGGNVAVQAADPNSSSTSTSSTSTSSTSTSSTSTSSTSSSEPATTSTAAPSTTSTASAKPKSPPPATTHRAPPTTTHRATAKPPTAGQEQALGAAQDYLNTQAFSRAGLIDQLSSSFGSGFSKADATWAVNHLTVNWNEEALKAGKEYLSTQHFSRNGLIEQLSSPYGSKFTRAQAIYAVNKLGL
jgi:hypothetical protein